MTSTDERFLSSQCESTELIRAVKGESEFPTADNLQAVKEERSDGRKTWDNIKEAKLEEFVKTLDAFDRHLFFRTKQTGSWLIAQGTMVTGTVLSAMEYHDFVCTCYKITPPNLEKYNG